MRILVLFLEIHSPGNMHRKMAVFDVKVYIRIWTLSILQAIFLITIYDYTPLMYPDKMTPYPSWAMGLGFSMSLLSMLTIPVYAVYCLVSTPGANLYEVGL